MLDARFLPCGARIGMQADAVGRREPWFAKPGLTPGASPGAGGKSRGKRFVDLFPASR
jgi:hypothetical protein